ncbi:MAG: LacI family DNA-binding transcriptional regulator [Lachnospiraceae bacterium]|nr:LacI family DNA-binding transcriptional regulator [Lachnospiraceae bacterium]
MSNVNMRDVASHAGVSIATVSHVINNTRFVKEETRQKVLDSIKALDYSPNALARSFKTGKKNLIAFIVPDIANPYFAALIDEIESTIAPKGYNLMICNTKESTEKESKYLHSLANGIVDGFIIGSSYLNYRPIADILPENTPVICVDRILSDCPCDTLTIDTSLALKTGIEYLIRQGHTRIAYITVNSELSTVVERRTAYDDTMAAHGLSTDGLIFTANQLTRLHSNTLCDLLQADISAVVAPNNSITSELLSLLASCGRTPGSDLEVLGFKESEQPQYVNPNMHLICTPSEALGRATGAQILERIEHPELPIRRTILSASFVPHK